ncbi:MAG: hypothetical protein V3T14_01365 [Myxococcota bacterium]
MSSSQLSFPTSLGDDALLSAVEILVRRENHNTAELLAHLAEIDRRKLFLREACPSMFGYCTKTLGFSESAAYYRITAARIARKYPLVLEHIRDGSLHLSGVSLLAPHLTSENHVELLRAARRCTKREIEERLAARRPRPAAPSIVRRLPSTKPAPARPQETPMRPATRTEPLGHERFKIQFTASRGTHELLQETQALIRHAVPSGDLDRIFNRALALLRDDLKRKRFARTERPRASSPGTTSRHIPAAVKRAVAARDGEQCSFLGARRRCGSREFLEFHHLDPWARSGRHSADGITLFCRAHNQYAADRDFGRPFMDGKRRKKEKRQ